MSPTHGKRTCRPLRRELMKRPISCARDSRFSSRITSSTASPAAHASGEPAKVPPRPPGPGASMISALPVTADSGTPPATLLAMVIRSGSTPACSIANMRPVRPKPDWISSAIKHDAMGVTQRAQAPQQLGRRRIEAAFAEHRLDDDRRHPRRVDVGLEQLLERAQRILDRHAVVGHREGQVVDLRQHRPEAGLVRLHLAGEADAGERASVEAARERDDGGAAACGSARS